MQYIQFENLEIMFGAAWNRTRWDLPTQLMAIPLVVVVYKLRWSNQAAPKYFSIYNSNSQVINSKYNCI